MKKELLILGVTGGAIVLLVAWLFGRGENLPSDATMQAKRVPDFKLEDYNGNVVSPADFAGKPLVINMWASWCPFCVDELPDFAAIQKEFPDQVVIVAIDRAESESVARRFTDELGISEDLVYLLDPSDSFYRSIGGFSMPETLFVEADGTIQFHKRGLMPIEEIRQRVEELLQ